jgi:capsular exopolysaccharide synthesis family protein
MELIQYLRLFKRWLWLILLAAFIAGGIAFIIASSDPPIYRSEVTMSIGSALDNPNPDYLSMQTGINLTKTYVEIVTTYNVLQSTADALNLSISPDALRSLISTEQVEDTSLFRIRVTYTDPVLAADIANTLAEQLILSSPTNLTREQLEQINFVQAQIDALNDQLRESRRQLEQIDNELSVTEDEAITRDLRDQRNALLQQINEASATVAYFSDTVSGLRQRSNSLEIVESARIPSSPSGTSTLNRTLLGVLVGATLAIGTILFVEYLDDTVRTTEEAAQTLALPVLGAIFRFGKKTDGYQERLVTKLPSMSPVAEGYRTVRTNLLFSTNTQDEQTPLYVVTSAGPSEGKSITTANVAATMALAGLNVLLIDADLRRPKVHDIFGLDNSVGLTTMLFADPEKLLFEQGKIPEELKECIQTTSVPRLRAITSGFIPSNPTEILGSTLMQKWIDVFRRSEDIDIVMIDTPPSLVVADTAVLAATTDAEVVIVLDYARTRRGAALKVKEKFVQLNVKVKGVILNRVNPREESYEYGYGYYYYSPLKTQPDGTKVNQ